MVDTLPDIARLAALLMAIGSAFGLGYAWRRGRPAWARGAHHRALSQAAMETQSIGLALRRLGDAPAAQALALQLLDVSDHLEELLRADEAPCLLVEERVPLLPLIEQSVSLASAQLGGAARPCKLDHSLGAITLRADGRAMRGAMVQVLVRAARLSRPEDHIDIRFSRIGNQAAIIIEDEGVGLATDELPAGTRGIGFGLSLARKLLHAHGGDLVFESATGIGTRAWLTLPEDRVLTGGRSTPLQTSGYAAQA